MPGVKSRVRRDRAQHRCPAQASTTSPSPTGTGTLPALPKNTSQKASHFTRAPREGKHPPRQVSGPSAFLPVLHRAPAPRSPPRSAPRTTPWAGREGEPRFQGPLNTDGIFLAASKRDQKEPCRTMGKIPPLVLEPSCSEQCGGVGHGSLRRPIRAIPVSLSAKRV